MTKMVDEISSFIKKDNINLGLEKKEVTALQDGFVGYIKTIRYYCFALSTHTIPILK